VPHNRIRSVRKDVAMRILHTSDWHIGRIWNQVDLRDVQHQFSNLRP
jgi:hypothetical protein